VIAGFSALRPNTLLIYSHLTQEKLFRINRLSKVIEIQSTVRFFDDANAQSPTAPAVGEVNSQMFNNELEKLLEKIADGDESALAALYDLTNKLIFSLVMRMLGDTAAAEDVLVNSYAQIWKQAALYKSYKGSALAWLISIARASAQEKFPAKTALQNIKVPSDSLCGEIVHLENGGKDFISERYRLVSSIINEFLPEQRQIIGLAYFSCLNQTEIAERLNLPLETIKLQLRDGMSKLGERLGNSSNK
jgi:RNA polymerase sigma-70 factor (ECF subfamily)